MTLSKSGALALSNTIKETNPVVPIAVPSENIILCQKAATSEAVVDPKINLTTSQDQNAIIQTAFSLATASTHNAAASLHGVTSSIPDVKTSNNDTKTSTAATCVTTCTNKSVMSPKVTDLRIPLLDQPKAQCKKVTLDESMTATSSTSSGASSSDVKKAKRDPSNLPPEPAQRVSVGDSSEEFSLQILTSEDEKPLAMLPAVSRKRKLSRKNTPRKKSRLSKNGSIDELVAFLQKVHGQRDKEKDEGTATEQTQITHSSPETQLTQVVRTSKVQTKNQDQSSSVSLESKYTSENATEHEKSKKKLPNKTVSPLKKEKLNKRRVNLTSVPIPHSKLGGSPLHLRTPSPVLVCRDSPNTIALVAESLVELSRSRGSAHDDSSQTSSTKSPVKSVEEKERERSSADKKRSGKRVKKKPKKVSLGKANFKHFLEVAVKRLFRPLYIKQ